MNREHSPPWPYGRHARRFWSRSAAMPGVVVAQVFADGAGESEGP
jgi:hypothetical protein